jgi:hypothetical protein
MSGKARPEALVVEADQRVGGEQVDVIGDQHQVTRREIAIDAARRVADDQRTHAELLHERRRVRHRAHVVAFVVVKAPLHGDDFDLADPSEHHPPGVACDRRRGEVRHIAVIDRGCIFHALDQLPQPRAEDHADRRPRRRPLADEGDRFFEFFKHPYHCCPSRSDSLL